MPGCMCFYISSYNTIHKISKPKNSVYKAVKSLCNQDVLFVLLYYETLNRIPYEMNLINFDRFKLDSNGCYKLTKTNIDKSLFNFNNFAFVSANELSKRDYIPIPRATIIPTHSEKQTLYKYIKQKYPILWSSFPSCMESHIKQCLEVDNMHKELVKKAYSIKFKNNLNINL